MIGQDVIGIERQTSLFQRLYFSDKFRLIPKPHKDVEGCLAGIQRRLMVRAGVPDELP